MEVLCQDGTRASALVVKTRNGRRYLYGWVPGERRYCYVGPAEPKDVLYSMPAAWLHEREAWSSALQLALSRLAENMAEAGAVDALRDLASLLHSAAALASRLAEEAERANSEAARAGPAGGRTGGTGDASSG
ncbi:MAG: hypothetical protein ACP5VF_13625 [Acidobacteriota bacterium]